MQSVAGCNCWEDRALTLDALGTIVALAPPAPVLRRELRDRLALELTEGQVRRALGAEIAYYRANLQSGRDAASLAALRARCAEVLRGALPASKRLNRVANAELTQALLASLRFSAFPDVRAALLAARERGERVVVASNWDVSLHDVLAQLELAPLLDGIVTSAEVGSRKPAPEVFRAALALAGTGPEHAIHVGDSLEEDVHGARAAGMRAVLLRRGGRESTLPGAGAPPVPDGVVTIASLAELVGH
jgi:putative hydrolase of the HAD superfamily